MACRVALGDSFGVEDDSVLRGVDSTDTKLSSALAAGLAFTVVAYPPPVGGLELVSVAVVVVDPLEVFKHLV